MRPRLLVVGDEHVLRAVRLRALTDAPDAFGASLDRAQGYDDTRWRELLAWGRWWVVDDSNPDGEPGTPLAVVAVVTDHGRPDDERHLVSMWVDPELRGTGTAGALVHAACNGARSEGAVRLTLWVHDDNAHACSFYARAGFTDTGERAVPHPGVVERRMWRQL